MDLLRAQLPPLAVFDAGQYVAVRQRRYLSNYYGTRALVPTILVAGPPRVKLFRLSSACHQCRDPSNPAAADASRQTRRLRC
jgi:hypothetical protein